MDIGLSSLLGSLGSGIASIFTASKQRKSAERQTQMVVDAQKAANAANLETQERINQQQIDNSRYINSLMRHDANNAVSIKKQDLINAGYSTADPNLSGASVASLTQPQLSSNPVVQSEYPSDLAALNQGAGQSLTDSLLSTAGVLSDFAVKRADVLSKSANTKSQEIRNSWLDAELQLNYDTSLQTLENLRKDGRLKDNDLKRFGTEMDILKTQCDVLAQNLFALKEQNKVLPKKLIKELTQLEETINLTRSNIAETNERRRVHIAHRANIVADTRNKSIEADLLNLKKAMDKINLNYAELGINFNSNSLVDSLLRLASSPKGHEAINVVMDFMGKSINNVVSRVTDHLPDWLK